LFASFVSAQCPFGLPGRQALLFRVRYNAANEGLSEGNCWMNEALREHLTEPMQLNAGGNMQSQMERDLKLEVEAAGMYNRLVAFARDEGDNASSKLFQRLLKDEEAHVDWLEAPE
jgi:hypothetical protein